MSNEDIFSGVFYSGANVKNKTITPKLVFPKKKKIEEDIFAGVFGAPEDISPVEPEPVIPPAPVAAPKPIAQPAPVPVKPELQPILDMANQVKARQINQQNIPSPIPMTDPYTINPAKNVVKDVIHAGKVFGKSFVANLSEAPAATLKGAKQWMDNSLAADMKANPTKYAQLMAEHNKRIPEADRKKNIEISKNIYRSIKDGTSELKVEIPEEYKMSFIGKLGGGFASLPQSLIPGVIALQTYGDSYDQAKAQGMPQEKAANYAASQAFLQEASERVGSYYLLKLIGDAGKLGIKVLKSAGTESTQELTQEGLAYLAEQVYGIKDDQPLKQRFFDAWAIGGLVGGGTTAVASPIMKAINKQPDQQPVPMPDAAQQPGPVTLQDDGIKFPDPVNEPVQKAREAVKEQIAVEMDDAVAVGDTRKVLKLEKEKAKIIKDEIAEATKVQEDAAKVAAQEQKDEQQAVDTNIPVPEQSPVVEQATVSIPQEKAGDTVGQEKNVKSVEQPGQDASTAKSQGNGNEGQGQKENVLTPVVEPVKDPAVTDKLNKDIDNNLDITRIGWTKVLYDNKIPINKTSQILNEASNESGIIRSPIVKKLANEYLNVSIIPESGITNTKGGVTDGEPGTKSQVNTESKGNVVKDGSGGTVSEDGSGTSSTGYMPASTVAGGNVGERSIQPGERSSQGSLEDIPDEVIPADIAHNKSLADSEIKTPVVDEKTAGDYEYKQKGSKKVAKGEKKPEGVDILSAYFTTGKLAEQMQDITNKLSPGKTILEPSAGSGNLIDKLNKTHDITAVEINQRAANVVKAKYPNTKVFNTWGEKYFANTKDKFHAVISNPPYMDYKGYFRGLRKNKSAPQYKDDTPPAKYQEYFLRESSKVLHDNGVMVFVHPSSFLRGPESSTKQSMNTQGMQVVKAFRLPGGLFGKDVGIDIDMVIYKKTGSTDDNMVDDNYFKSNPSDVLGTIETVRDRFGKDAEKIVGNHAEAAQAIQDYIDGLSETKPAQSVKDTIANAGFIPTHELRPKGKTLFIKINMLEDKPTYIRYQWEKGIQSLRKSEIDLLRLISTEPKVKGKTPEITKGTKKNLRSYGDEKLEAIYKNPGYDGSVDLDLESNPEELNYLDGKIKPNFFYTFGNIAERLKDLEFDKENISTEQYNKQKKLLESVRPPRVALKDMSLDPTISYFNNNPLREGYTDWIRRQDIIKYNINSRDAAAYMKGKVVRGNLSERSSKDYEQSEAGRKKKERDRAADINFRNNRLKYVAETFSQYLQEKEQQNPGIAQKLNDDLFSNYTPDFSTYPFFIDKLSATFKDEPLVIGQHQKEAIGFMSSRNLGYFAGEVGAGKTMVNIITTEKALQSGRAKRPVIICPPNIISNFTKEYPDLFPERKVVNLSNLGVGMALPKMEDGTVYVMSYTALPNIKYNNTQFDALRTFLLGQLNNETNDKRKAEVASVLIDDLFTSKVAGAGSVEDNSSNKKDHLMEDLGFDMVSFDEAHLMRNLFTFKSPDFKGMGQTNPSDVAIRGYILAAHIFLNNNQQNVMMYSGTPFNNRPDEVYNVLSFVAQGAMKDLGVESLEDFTKMFAQKQVDWIVDKNNNLKRADVVTGFKNGVMLRQLIASYILPKFSDDLDLVRPEKRRHMQHLKENSFEENITTELRNQLDAAQELSTEERKKVELSLQTQIRQAAVSPFLILFPGDTKITGYTPKQVIEQSTKLDYISKQIKHLYDQNKDQGQIIYHPMGKKLLPIWKEYLVKHKGFTADQVAIIDSSTNDKAKLSIMDNFNAGKIKVLMGTRTIQVGLNLQKRSTAMYHTLIEWNPTDLIQAEGRLYRQGNIYDWIYSVFPLLANSGDAVYLQKLEEKAARFNDIYRRDDQSNVIDVASIDASIAKLDVITDPVKKAKAAVAIEKESLEADVMSLKDSLPEMARKELKRIDLSKYPSGYFYTEELNRINNKVVLDQKEYSDLENRMTSELSALVDPKLKALWNEKVDAFESRHNVKFPRSMNNIERIDFANKKNINIDSLPVKPNINNVVLPNQLIGDKGLITVPTGYSPELKADIVKLYDAYNKVVLDTIDSIKKQIEEKTVEIQTVEDKHSGFLAKFTEEAKKPKPSIKMLKAPEYRQIPGKEAPAKKKSLTETIASTGKNVDQQIDKLSQRGSIPLGKVKAKPLNIPDHLKGLNFLDEEIEKVWEANNGIGKEGFIQKAKQALADAYHSSTRHFPELNPKTDGLITDILRRFMEVPSTSVYQAQVALSGIVADLDPASYDVFKRNIIYADLANDVSKGLYVDVDGNQKELPNKFTPETLTKYYESFRDIAEANPAIKKAIETRNEFMKSLKQELVKYNILPAKVLKDDSYFHHQVLEHVRNKDMEKYTGVSSSDARRHMKGWQLGRGGVANDYNTNYLESEFEVISESLAKIGTEKTLEEINKAVNIKQRLKSEAKQQNLINVYGGEDNYNEYLSVKAIPNSKRSDEQKQWMKENDVLRPYNMKLGMANAQLQKMAEDGDLDNLAYPDVVRDLRRGSFESPRYFEYLSYLMDNDLDGSKQAGIIFKNIYAKEQFIKDTLKKEYVTWEDIIPKDYSKWQPESGKLTYQAYTTTDKIVEKAMEENKSISPEDMTRARIIAGNKEEWVVPSRVAKTLSKLKPVKDEVFIGKLAVSLNNSWKQWILMMPLRAVKYNINNMSGDLDIAFAYNPKIIKGMLRSGKDLWGINVKGKAPSAEILEAMQYGVINTGQTVYEIPDINNTGIFKSLTNEKETLIEKYWHGVKNFSQWRENILRLSAYRFFLKELEAGKTVYGVSKQSEIDAIKNNKHKAAKLARELMGDYGNISKTGVWLRDHMMPFYSWAEINAPRYYRLLKNSPLEGDTVDSSARVLLVGGKKVLFTIAKMFALYALVAMWNGLFFPEEEKEIGKQNRQLHLVLGRNEDGSVKSIRFQGALSDALSWFGLQDFPAKVSDLMNGQATAAETTKKMKEDVINKVAGMVSPAFKAPAEIAFKKSLYPDIFNPRIIRDRGEYLANIFSMGMPYRFATGMPTRKVEDEVSNLVLYKTDTGEAAYNESRSMIINFMKKQGKETPGYTPTDKANALYYYKKAKAYGDRKAEKKYKAEYFKLDGTVAGMVKSIKMAHPLGTYQYSERESSEKTKLRNQFLRSLTPSQKKVFQRSIAWYKKIYK